jgi:protein involved in polysaccharide export with SLBB domain
MVCKLRVNLFRGCVLPVLLAAIGASAMAQTPTPQQLELFRSLTPEQQRQVLQQIQGQGQISMPSPGVSPMPTLPTSIPKTTDPMQPQPGLSAFGQEPAEPRLKSGDQVLLGVEEIYVAPDPAVPQPVNPLTDQKRASTEFVRQVLDGNPYRLDRSGRIHLPGTVSVVLAGLTEMEAAQRLDAEPALRNYRFLLRLLPVEPELRPFGYDLFSTLPTTFTQASDIPVPPEYVVGPGDTLRVLLIGEQGGQFTLPVGRDGAIDFPQLGPIQVAGMRFAAAKDLIEQRVAEQMIGMRASVSMGELRSIQVFVVGEAERPGSYTVSGLSTVTNVLFASGGVKPIGSLRGIQVKRNGQVVRSLDLYDLLLDGDSSNDVRLQSGDVILIPPVGTTVAISGEVLRPAIYELKEKSSVSDILHLAGGLTPEADPRTGRLERIDDRRNRIVMNIDLTSTTGRAMPLQSGDAIRVLPIRSSMEGSVGLFGHVHREGTVQHTPGMRLTDLIGSLDEFKPLADLHYVLIRRETGPTRKVSVVSADAAAAFTNPDSAANVALQPRDRVYAFDVASSRDRVVAPIILDLTRQASRNEPLQVVGIGGRAKVPGQYPLEQGMRVSDLLRAGGSLDQAAYGSEAELTRYEVVNGEERRTELFTIDLGKLATGDASVDMALQPFDYLVVKEVTFWSEQEFVTLMGEVRFPGRYPVSRGETMRSVVLRAGGLTEHAFPEGSVFTRQDLKEREQRQLGVLGDRLRREIAVLSLQRAQSGDAIGTTQAIAAGESLLTDLDSTDAIGRLVIDLDRSIRATPGSPMDIIMKDGDMLAVPRHTQEVTVIGEVQNSASLLFIEGFTRDDYIARSGGMTRRADDKRVFIIRADGSVAAEESSGWFGRSGDTAVRPGDTIVVPLDAAQMRPLTVWTSITQILYNIAVAVAAVNSF